MTKITITDEAGKKVTVEEGRLVKTRIAIPRVGKSPIPAEKSGMIKKIKTIGNKVSFVVSVGTKDVEISLRDRNAYLDFHPKADKAEVKRIVESLSNDKIH